jgi:hypothetical protein
MFHAALRGRIKLGCLPKAGSKNGENLQDLLPNNLYHFKE